MTTLPFLSTLREVAYGASLALFAAVLLFIFVFLLGAVFSRAAARVRAFPKRRILDALYRYMLGEMPLEGIALRRSQRRLALELLSSILGTIKGNKQERMKEVVVSLGLVREIERGLSRPSAARRILSCYRLGLLGSKGSLGLLLRALNDRNPRVAAASIIALAEIRDARAVSPLIGAFVGRGYAHAWLVAAVLPFFGRGTCEEILPYLKAGALPPRKLVLLLKVFSEQGGGECFDRLLALYEESEDLDVRIGALGAIGRTGDVRAVKTVVEALRSADWELRAVACRVLGGMSAGGAAYKLIPSLKDPNWHVRRNAAGALAQLGKPGMNVLLACLDIDDEDARGMVVHTLEESGVVDRAVRASDGGEAAPRKEALLLLRSLARKGYRTYLGNFRATSPAVDRIMREAESA